MVNALAELRDVVRSKPQDAEAQFNVGYYLQKRGKHKDAAAYYRKSLALHGNFSEAMNNLAAALFMMGQHVASLRELERASRLRPRCGITQRNKALVLDWLHRGGEACVNYKRATELLVAAGQDKMASNTFHLLGFALQRAGMTEDAITAYRRALRWGDIPGKCKDDLNFVLAMQRQSRGYLSEEQRKRDQTYLYPGALNARIQQHSAQLGKELRQLPRPSAQAGPPAADAGRLRGRPSWRPAAYGAWLKGFRDERYLPIIGHKRGSPSLQLAPRWRAAKKAAIAAVGPNAAASDLIRDGEYVPPRPAYLDPIGNVPQCTPLVARATKGRPSTTPSITAALLQQRSTVRRLLATVGFDSTELARQLDESALTLGQAYGPRLCWEITPRGRLRYRLPPTTSQEADIVLAERRAWRC